MVIGILVGIVLMLIAGAIIVGDYGNETAGFVAAALAVVVFGLTFTLGQAYHNQRTIECTIVDKDRGVGQDGTSEYRVYTEQCGTFVNQDSLFRGKFNSGDIQGQLQVGETYELEVAGARFPLFSMFPNIFEVRPIAN